MFIKNKNQRRYSGIDSTPWRVVTFSGKELCRFENIKDKKTNKVIGKSWVTRWDGFRSANEAARVLGGVAVRA